MKLAAIASSLVVLTIVLQSHCTVAQRNTDVPLPSIAGPIQTTPGSTIYGRSWNIDLADAGYVEEEYFVSGKANVYDYGDNNAVKVRTPDVPYTTRLLVRRPVDPAKFSGNVIVEIINMSRGWDLDVMWQMQHEYILRNGDAYVGVTSKPNAVRALKRFDPKRYGPLSWPNPLPLGDPRNCSSFSSILPNDTSRETENGLFWDIFSQVGALLKSDDPKRPLHQLSVKYLYAIGYSQSGGFLKTYIDAITPQAYWHRKLIYDGYLVGAAPGPTPINQCAPKVPASDPRYKIKPRGVPIITVMTNTDFLWGYEAHRADGDTPDDKFRLYEVPGASHGYEYPGQFEPTSEDIKKAGFDNRFSYECITPRTGNDFPLQYVFDTALKALDLWARNGTAPPHGQPIEVTIDRAHKPDPIASLIGSTTHAVAKLDQYGNALGGVRTPFVDVPTATYHPEGINDTDKFAECGMSKTPFDHDLLLKLYPTHEDYVKAVEADTDRLVSEGWLLTDDADEIKARAEAAAIP